MEIEMNTLPILGILILMLLVVSGYVSSDETQAIPVESAARHVDPHLNYYEEHLIAMGIERRKP
jgi:hypothetical protein